MNAEQKDHETPLHFASFRGKLEIARLLLDYGAKMNAKNAQGETPLHLVSRGEYNAPTDGVLVAKLLLDRGVDVNAQDKRHWTTLHSASYNGKPEIVQILLYHSAKVNAETDLGETPLHLVRPGKYGSQDGIQVVRLLLEGGIDVNAHDKRNWTPLHAASYHGRLEIVRVLLDQGARANAKNNRGETPLHQVAQGEYESQADGVRVAQHLLDRGADVNAQDKSRKTPLHVASRCGRPEIVRLLLAHTTAKNDRRRAPAYPGLEGGYLRGQIQ